jgi:hypothetical protein
MRLYSLKRIDLPPAQKDDVEVITEGICNIETLCTRNDKPEAT